MTRGERLICVLRAAACACWGFFIGGILGIVLFVIADLNLRLTPHEPAFGWFWPMMWTGFGCGVIAACVGALLVARYDLAAARARREEARRRKQL